MEFNEDFMGGYTVDLPKVVESTEMLAVTRLLASTLMVNPYINVGEYISKLSDADLGALNEMVDNSKWEDIIVMAEMLATGEGLPSSETTEMFQDRMSGLCSFLVIESLKRKGLVKVHYENMSFGEDMGDKIVVERI